jgi:hypothetical protein
MNLHNVFGELEKADPEVYDRLDSRRAALKGFARMGSKIALAAVPLALGSMFKKAYGGTNDTVVEILNYALTLEYLESEFYSQAVTKFAQIGVPAGAAQGAITTIRDHENAHVAFLKSAIVAAGGAAVAKPNFDFSGGKGSMTGPFATVFSNYGMFLAVAQTFEDTGVRAYKGRAAELTGGGALLTAALNIHSVEARHASHIRQMRKANGFADVKPWITLKNSGGAPQAPYDGEESTMQAGVQITNIGGNMISAEAASEAFDEGLSKAQVLAIVDPFIAP